VSLPEKIEILVFLSTDSNVEVSRQALHTLRHWNVQELDQVLSDPSTPSAVIDFVFDRMVEEQGDLCPALARNSASSGALPPPSEGQDSSTPLPVPEHSEPVVPPEAEADPAGTTDSDPGRETLLQRIARMTVAEKIRMALMGSQEERLVLIRDANRVVTRSVLQSPKTTESEVQSFASMREVKEEVLRIISKNRAFVKNPAVVRALVFNPRSPIDVSLPLIKLLKDRDLKLLTIDKNVPDPIRNNGMRLYLTRTQKR